MPGGKPRLDGIDTGRLLAFVGVVCIHAYDMGGPIAFWAAAWGRFAVPMFFIVSGYFMSPDGLLSTGVRKYSERLLPLYLFWAALYLVVYAAWPSSIKDWAMLLIKGGRGNHLWFIPSLWLCLVTGLCLIRTIGLRGTGAIAATLYAVGLAIGSYGPVTGLAQSAWNPRDGLMFGLVFVVIGSALRGRALPLRLPLAALLFAIFSIVHLGEFYLISRYHPEYTDFFITTPALAVTAFLTFAAWRPAHAWTRKFAELGRYSLGFYAIHMFFINLAKTFLPSGVVGWSLAMVLVVALSVACTLLLAQVGPLRRFLR